MNSFDNNWVSTSEQSFQNRQLFNKDEWARRKKAERQELYELADSTTQAVSMDGGKFQAYLDVQARFDRYSTTNALLILAQMPQATQVKDFDGWKNAGFSVKRHPQRISILEPGGEYQRGDGSVGTFYNVKKVFDISQTTSKAKAQPTVKVNDRLLLKALIYRSPVPIQMTDELPNHMGAYYDHEQQTIFVRRGMSATDIFHSVSMELACAEIAAAKGSYTRETAGFAAYSVSYLLCQRFGIDVNGYDFRQTPDHFRDSGPKDIRAALTEIRDTAETISVRMTRVLEQNKAPRIKEQER